MTIGAKSIVLTISVLCLCQVHLSLAKRAYTDNDLDTYDAPEDIKRHFPYYLAGKDYDGQPLFIMECGKWPTRRIVEEGSDDLRSKLDKYYEQFFYTMQKTAEKIRAEDDTASGNYVFLIDMDGYTARELSHLPTVGFVITNFTQRFERDFSQNLDYGFLINANFVTETLLGLLKPVLGQVFAKLEVLGTNKAKWLPQLLKKIPRESLPPWYGGLDSYKPLAVYG